MRILIADDHPLVIKGLRMVIEEMYPEASIFECADFFQVDQLPEVEWDFDLAILDLKMPGIEGTVGVKNFLTKYKNTPVLIISGNYTYADVSKILTHGAQGFVPKGFSVSGLVNAIELVLAEIKFVPAEILLECRAYEDLTVEVPGRNEMKGPLGTLTRREGQVLNELTQGLRNKDIARNLEIEEVTVKLHLKNIFKKLGVSNRTHVVKIAHDLGWL